MNSNFRYVESSLINLLADPAREKGDPARREILIGFPTDVSSVLRLRIMISIDHACVLHIQSRHVSKIIYLWWPCTKLMAYTWIFLPAARKFSFFLYSNQSFIWRTCQTLIWTFGQPHVLIMEANLGTLTPACRYMHLFSFTWRTHGHHSPPNILKNIIRPVHKHPFNQETLLFLIALTNFFFSRISLTKIWCHHLQASSC